MGARSPIQVPSTVSNLTTLPEVVRFLGAFATEVASKFNSLIANKEVYGSVGGSGLIGVTGSGNFGVSFVSTGVYWIAFREPFFTRPAILVSTERAPFLAASEDHTVSGFFVRTYNTSGNLVNMAFAFLAKGPK